MLRIIFFSTFNISLTLVASISSRAATNHHQTNPSNPSCPLSRVTTGRFDARLHVGIYIAPTALTRDGWPGTCTCPAGAGLLYGAHGDIRSSANATIQQTHWGCRYNRWDKEEIRYREADVDREVEVDREVRAAVEAEVEKLREKIVDRKNKVEHYVEDWNMWLAKDCIKFTESPSTPTDLTRLTWS